LNTIIAGPTQTAASLVRDGPVCECANSAPKLVVQGAAFGQAKLPKKPTGRARTTAGDGV